MRQRLGRRSGPAAVAAIFLVVQSLMLAACGVAAPSSARPAVSPSTVMAPFNTTVVTASGTWAVLPMGILSQPLNTFWQLFFRPMGSSRWSLVTPPGVALNGGLVIDEAGAGPFTAGIEPTNLLTFSPLAQRAPGGHSWSAGVLPGGLAPVPEALASSAKHGLLALLRNSGGEVVRSTASPSAWTALVTRKGLAASIGGASCQVSALSSVAFSAAGADLVGAACGKAGVVGVFSRIGASWKLIGPRLGGSLATEPATVLGLWGEATSSEAGDAGLVATNGGSPSSFVAIWERAATSVWTVSAPLQLPQGARLVSSGSTGDGELYAVLRQPNGTLVLETISRGRGWQQVDGLPVGTSAVAVGKGGVIDALATARSVMTDWRRIPSSGTWHTVQAIRVPIALGSSS